MFDSLTIVLTLGAGQCVRGESVFFEVIIENTSRDVLNKLMPLDEELQAVRLIAKDAKAPTDAKTERRATAYSAEFRDGAYLHEPDDYGMVVTLRPGQKMQLKGDLLAWFGELPPGTYEIVAEYATAGRSEPASLKVVPAAPVSATVPRFATHAGMAQQAAAWTHKQKEGAGLFYQLQSAALPRNPRFCWRVADVKEPFVAIAAAAPSPKGRKGHLLWQDAKGKLFVGLLDKEKPRTGQGVELPTPFTGKPLLSPLTMPDGGLRVPYTDEKQEQMTVLTVAPDGAIAEHPLDLGKIKPIGPYVCFWEYAARLHFAWAAPNGRQIYYARLPLDDPTAGFVSESAHISDDPILWIDAYRDTEAGVQEIPYIKSQRQPGAPDNVQPSPPPIVLWRVTRTSLGLECARVSLPHGSAKTVASFSAPSDGGFRVICSVVSQGYDLHLLLADKEDQLFYASTAQRSITPLAQAAEEEITLDQTPSLMTPGLIGRVPWVYVRYVKDKSSIDYVRLEPSGEQDPVERQTEGKPARRR